MKGSFFGRKRKKRQDLKILHATPEACPICGDSNGPFFRLRYGGQPNSTQLVWDLWCPSSGWRRGHGAAVNASQNVKELWYCRRGDVFQISMAAWKTELDRRRSIFIRIAGPAAGGKSEVIRELSNLPAVIVDIGGVEDDSVPVINVSQPATVGAGHGFKGGHEHATRMDGSAEGARVNLHNFLTYADKDIQAVDTVYDMLKSANLSEDDALTRWGSDRLPVLRKLSIDHESSTLCDLAVYYFDLPGELWTVGRTEYGSAEYYANLAGAQHLLVAIDGALLTTDIEEEPLRQSMRPQDLGNLTDAQRDRRAGIRTFLSELAMKESRWDATGTLPVTYVITKADVMREALRVRAVNTTGASAWVDQTTASGGLGSATESMIRAAVTALDRLAKEIRTHELTCSAGVSDLLVAGSPQSLELRSDHLTRIVSKILTHFAKPRVFWELVWDPDESGGGVIDGLPKVRVENVHEYWRGVVSGVRVQDRDMVNTVLGAALMHNLGVNVQAVHQGSRQVRYFLTCSREIVLPNGGVDRDAQGIVESTGMHTLQAHVISRAVQQATVRSNRDQ